MPLAEPGSLLAQLPPQSGDFRTDPAFFLALLGIGFVIGALGHLFKSRAMIAIGVILIFAATVVIPLGLQISR